ncbi:MAG: SH3 domain-containing protein [Chloroflexi bacterium]|nr:SH3 domain-containing protein [Chloroflexota bacterium]
MADQRRVLGIDVSKWQGEMNWVQAARAGAWFAFIKATQGTRVVDPMFQRNWNQSRGLVLRGAYHFYEPDQDPQAQAEHFVHTLPADDRGELPLVLDLERGHVTWHDVARFMQRVQELDGREPILYTSPGYVAPMGPPPKPWPLWIAHYHVDQPALPPGWSKWTFWQYSATGPGPQYGAQSKHIDLNVFNGSLEDLIQFAGLEWGKAAWWRCGRLERLGATPATSPGAPEPSGERRVVTAYRLRVRSGPGTEYGIVGVLQRGDVVTVLETKDGWGRIGPGRWIALRYTAPA